MKERNGIASAGNWILDITKIIDVYPEQDTLANISEQSSNNGGAPYNVLKDLAKLEAPFPLYGIGLVGNDQTGKQIKKDCDDHSIDASQISYSSRAGTSYTDVMLVRDTGRRTFYHYRGANALFDLQHIDLQNLRARILHLGYLLLLDSLDEVKNTGRTNASVLLEEARALGFKTTVDIVSENRNRFKRIITPSLPYIDVLFCNEYEAGKLTDMDINTENPDMDKVKEMIDRLLNLGVKEWVILHFSSGCVAGNTHGEFVYHGSVNMPEDTIIGATGAGDAFAAGTLYGYHEGWSMDKCLELGVSSAAMSLTQAGCSDGIGSKAQCLHMGQRYGYRKLK
jgi:sugar/nucleoside kinase (ribokinase family)